MSLKEWVTSTKSHKLKAKRQRGERAAGKGQEGDLIQGVGRRRQVSTVMDYDLRYLLDGQAQNRRFMKSATGGDFGGISETDKEGKERSI